MAQALEDFSESEHCAVMSSISAEVELAMLSFMTLPYCTDLHT